MSAATSGANDDGAFMSAHELLACALYGLEEEGEEIPAPTPLTQVQAGENERTALIDVYIPLIRLAQVNRTVTLPAWLNAAALEKGVNFSQLLQDALREKLNVR